LRTGLRDRGSSRLGLLAEVTHCHLRGIVHERLSVVQIALMKIAAVDVMLALPGSHLLSYYVLRSFPPYVQVHGIQGGDQADGLEALSPEVIDGLLYCGWL
jgi:hypothetical protein